MADDSDVEKTEPASEQRLQKSREDGQVARSRELNTCLLLLGGATTLWIAAPLSYRALSLLVSTSLTFDHASVAQPEVMIAVLVAAIAKGAEALWPIFAVTVIVSLLASVALGGLVLSTKAMAPKFSRMNPLKGVTRMVSAQSGVELIKTLGKAILVAAVGAAAVSNHMPQILSLMHASLHQGLYQGLQIVATVCIVVIGSLLIIALIDVPWQLYSHHKKLRMSKEEVRREHKESEGDPHVKGRIRQQQREAARRRMMSDVPSADVIVTNPTHYAVALRYSDAEHGAPVVVAKGTNLIAERIKSLAGEHQVPVLSAPPLARALHHHVDIGQQIPAELYTAVAQVLAWVFALRNHKAGLAPAPVTPSQLPVPQDMDPQFAPGLNTEKTL